MFIKWQIKKIKKIQDQVIDMQSEMLDKNQQKLTKIANQRADIQSEAITKKAKALKKGFHDAVFCKYCGESIDSDSNFCKHCGKKQ